MVRRKTTGEAVETSSTAFRCGPADCGSSCLPVWLDEIETKLKNRLAKRAIEVFRKDPTNTLSVGEWANRLGVSREHLTRSISPIINPHALILATRLAMAMERLANQDRLRAGEALDVMGYSSRAHAFMVFKAQTGLTPSQWWRLHHRGESPSRSCVADRCPLLGALLDRSHERTIAMSTMGNANTGGNGSGSNRSTPANRTDFSGASLVEEPVAV